MAGFIKLDRSIFEHWIFQDAEKFRAFVDLIQLARWKDEKLLVGNELITIPRGSYYTSELKLAERWGWSRNKTREFLKLLENEKMITKKGTSKGTTVTIENYRFYQDEDTTKDTTKKHQKDNEKTTEGTSNGHQKDSERYTKEEYKEYIRKDKEREEGKEEVPSLPPLFFSTPIHKKIYDQFGEVDYRTFFMEAEIKELDKEIIITHQDNFIENMILDRWIGKLKFLLGKRITVGEE